MAFCTNTDVTDITGSDLDTAIIDRIITASDRKINRMLREGGLSTNPSPTPDDIKDASAYYSAATVLNRHMVDGTLPAQYKAEGLSEQTDVKTVIANYNREADMAMNLYIEENVSDSDLGIFRVVGSRGARVGAYETMTTEEEDEN